jgi:large subunit ribosomal protein L20
MPRVKTGPVTRRRKKKVLKSAKGYWGSRSKVYRRAKETLIRALSFQTRDRKNKKRDFRALWITRINIACRQNGISYSQFIKRLKELNILLDRKTLADLAVHQKRIFTRLTELAKAKS